MPRYKELTAEQFALRAGCSLAEVMKSLCAQKLPGRVIMFVEYRVVLDIFKALGQDVDYVKELIVARSGASPRTLHLIREENLEPFIKARQIAALMPEEVIRALGYALNPEEKENFWVTPNQLLGDQSPKTLWERGEKQRILDFIKSAKSGDMA